MTDQIPEKKLPLPLILVICGILIGINYNFRLWELGDNGLSLVSKTTPYWDFNNLWSGSRMALGGHVDWLFDPELYRQELRRTISEDIPNHEWSYPPSVLLIGIWLAKIPEFYAYILWTLGSILLLFAAVKTLKIPLMPSLAIVLSPAVFYNALYGQNAALTGALLLAGLTLAPRRPILAGICIGLLTIKPQLGILIPFLLIASGNWKTIWSAGLTTITLVVATGLAFGFDVWEGFFTQTQPLMRAIMEASHPQAYHTNATTIFVAARSLQLSLPVSYLIQGIGTLACIITAMRIWHKNYEIDHNIRVAITCVLTFLATPYAYTYDLVAVNAAIAIFYVLKPDLKYAPLFGLIWLFPVVNHSIAYNTHLNIGGVVLLGLLALMFINKNGGTLKQNL